MTSGTTQQSSAPYNRRIVLDLIGRHGPLSRKEIVERVGLSAQTVANITNDLEAVGLIASRRSRAAGSRGQPPMVLAINPEAGHSIGIAVEPGRMSAALVNLGGSVLERREVELDTHHRPQVRSAMVGLVRELAARSGRGRRIWGIGVALPGPLVATEISFVGPTVMEGWSDLSLLDELGAATGLPVIYGVDSVAGALGETLFGVARHLDDFFYLHLGVGLGGTLVVNRAAYRGANGNATEIGHIPIVPGGRQCYCGNRGCLERYVSLHAMDEALGTQATPQRGARLAERLATGQDDALRRWCEEAGAHLRNAICVIENTLDPSTIVIGGSAPRLLVERLVQWAQPLARSVRGGIAQPQERILVSAREQDSSILGAAVLPIYETLAPRVETLQIARHGQDDVAGLLGGRVVGRAGRV